MKYYADQWTDAELDALEKKIVAEYGKAGREVRKKAQEYFRKFRAQDLEMLARLEDGEITEEYYRLWRMNQLGRGERWEKLADNLAQRVTAANMTASAYINDTTPGIYSFNHNYEAYSIEKVAANVSFTLMDEQTVKRLLMRQVKILPVTQVKERTDLSWNKRSLQKELLSGIMQGESIDKMAVRFTHVTGMNQTSAIRNARTAVTGAQNAGRYTAISEANEMGCKAEKQWMATLDRRTRKSHQHMDLEHVPVEQQFSNGCMYPGDMDCRDGAEIYNCRCTMVSYLSPELMAEPMTRWTGEVDGNGDPVYVEDMSYEQWKEWKQKSYAPNKTGGIIKPDKTMQGHSGTPKQAAPGSVIDHLGNDGKTETRTFYGKSGYKEKDITTHDHGFPKKHPYGKHGEHAHDYEWYADGSLKSRTTREISEAERKENRDIL